MSHTPMEMATKAKMQPSSASEGFFQVYPHIQPAYTGQTSRNARGPEDANDGVLSNILKLYLPDPLPAALDSNLSDFAQKCLDPDTLRLSVDAEANQPTLHSLTTFGEVNDVNPLRTGEGWRGLKDIQTRAGVIAHGYCRLDSVGNYNLRVHQFALAHLWGPSCASVSCPAAMSDGAAILLSRHLNNFTPAAHPAQDPQTLRTVLQQAYDRLTSFDPNYAWTSGQWMTERPGGSDVSRTETLAHLASAEEVAADGTAFGGGSTDSVGMPLGPWLIDGFKWFSSATDADMVVLLAQTEKGLSAFYAPMKRVRLVTGGNEAVVMNGVRISRLKNKLGTKSLPTAELEIKGMRGWLLGEEGKGVKEISAILNATRLWTAGGAVSSWARALAVSQKYAKVRKIKGEQLLADNKQHLKWMADETVKHYACAHLAFLGVALLGVAELGWEVAAQSTASADWLPKDRSEAEILLRVLTPVMKAQCSLWSVLGLRECMESLGGVGYCENVEEGGLMNIARLLRDCAVNSIWEGTTNILGEDLVRVVKGKGGNEAIAALDSLIDRMLRTVRVRSPGYARDIGQSWKSLKASLSNVSVEEGLYRSRQTLQQVQGIVCSLLLNIDVAITQSAKSIAIADRFMSWQSQQVGDYAGRGTASEQDPLLRTENNRLIFLGASRGPSKL